LGQKGINVAEVEWSDFKVILALSRGGSVAAASRILGVDSSTVSRKLAAAEESLGATLVLRGGREFRFTAEGDMALRTAESMETAVLSTASAIKSAKQAIEGKVKITTVGSFYHFLMPICAVLHKQHPNLHVEIFDSDQMVNLAAGEADIGLRFAYPKEPDLIARKAFDLGWCVYASKDYAAEYGLPKTPDELREHRLILYTETRHHLPGFAWMEQFKTHEERFTRVNSTSVALRLVLSGGGISALPCWEEGAHTNLVRVFALPFHHQPAYIVFHESLRDSARIRVVADALMDYLHSQKKLLQGTDQER
jgi:DNA-binding transcriptional LysR family regulator